MEILAEVWKVAFIVGGGIGGIIFLWLAFRLLRSDTQDWEDTEQVIVGFNRKMNMWVLGRRLRGSAIDRILNASRRPPWGYR